MPYYYDTSKTGGYTSNVSGGTETTHLRFLTIANQETSRICGVYGGCRFGTAGGAILRVKTWTTPSTGGTSVTPTPRNPRSAATQLTALNDASAITPGTTQFLRLSIGMAQTGGMGGWVALEPAHAIALLANAGANGNADFVSIANAASVTFDFTVETADGS